MEISISLAGKSKVNSTITSITPTMTNRRPAETQEMSRAKRPKLEESDPAKNPYLAHMYEEQDESYGNSYGSSNGRSNGSSATTGLSKFKRHATTAAQAHVAEDGPANPFNNAPLSKQYFNILRTRRELPVHKQRYALYIQFGYRGANDL